ncbi:MAG: hypothetical protein GYA14_09565 [Ignavibacteria bacterium]|nr:hypothetical protein [Ignavibacteria bacterium]
MQESTIDIKQTFEFVIKVLETISEKRKNKLLTDKCISMKESLDSISGKETIHELRSELYHQIDQLKFIVQAEIRFFLFPIPEIKQETYELGKKYMNNFLEWFNSEVNITIEEILKLLDEEIYLLEEAKVFLDQIILDEE